MTVSPKLREWNLNTILIALGLMAALVGWGMTWAASQADIERNTADIAELRQMLHEIDASNQRFANLDYRVSVEEKATAASPLHCGIWSGRSARWVQTSALCAMRSSG